MSEPSKNSFPVWDDPTQVQYHRVTINTETCDGCSLCVTICPANVLELVGEKPDLKAQLMDDYMGCMSCNNCYAICATQSIKATVFYNFTGYYKREGRGEFLFPRKF